MVDLSTRYLDLDLANPLVVSAGPVSKNLDEARRVEDAGASAMVMYSLFEEQIRHEEQVLDACMTQGTESFPEAVDYIPRPDFFVRATDQYIEQLRKTKEALGIPVIASLNGATSGGWTSSAKVMQDAGADALELNLYALPTDPSLDAATIEAGYLSILAMVKDVVTIPVAVKIHPFFSNIAFMARSFVECGAAGLVLFNRFYQPDIDLERLEVEPRVTLSDSGDMLLPLRWIAMLRGRVHANLAITGGVHTGRDALKGLMAGADVTMMMTALLLHGPQHITRTLEEIRAWMVENEYESVSQLKGSMSHAAVADPGRFERVHYMKLLDGFTRAVS